MKRYYLGYFFKVIGTTLENTRNHDLIEWDLTSQQLSIIMFLSDNQDKEINALDIEKRFNLSSATISGILKRLELKDLICRMESSKSLKFKKIILTEKCLAFYKKTLSRINKLEMELLEGFSDEEKDQFANYLVRIKDNIVKEKK